jgi:ubiquitin
MFIYYYNDYNYIIMITTMPNEPEVKMLACEPCGKKIKEKRRHADRREGGAETEIRFPSGDGNTDEDLVILLLLKKLGCKIHITTTIINK